MKRDKFNHPSSNFCVGINSLGLILIESQTLADAQIDLSDLIVMLEETNSTRLAIYTRKEWESNSK